MNSELKAWDKVEVTTGDLKGKVGIVNQIDGDRYFVNINNKRHWLLKYQLKFVGKS